jgi:hypothetical protein
LKEEILRKLICFACACVLVRDGQLAGCGSDDGLDRVVDRREQLEDEHERRPPRLRRLDDDDDDQKRQSRTVGEHSSS